jgi:tripartite-type tricarboxylate transporter receptor subunit TctC
MHLQSKSRRAVLANGVALAASAAAGSLRAQERWPTKPIDLITPTAAGGGGDIAARIQAKYLSRELGQPVNVVNRPGGNFVTGTLAMLNSPPDGYTLMSDANAMSSLAALMKDLPYKIEARSWGPMTMQGPYIYAVHGTSPWKSLKDVAEAARKSPDSFRMAWLGGGGLTDLTLLKFLDLAGVDVHKIRRVPFPGSGPGMTALAGGHIDFAGGSASAATSYAASGHVRVLAVTGDKRIAAYPNAPSSKEAGYYVDLIGWYGISGPPGVPRPIMDRLDAVVQKIVKDPEYIQDLERVGHVPWYLPSDKTWAYIQQEIAVARALKAKMGTGS